MDYGAYLRSLQRYFVIAILLFFGTAIMGFTVAEQNPSIAEEWLKELEMLKWITDLPPPMIAIMIFAKNLIACAMAIFLGVAFGVVPLLVAISNGILVGIVSYHTIQKESLLYLMAGILPHGIIELPTVLMCIAIGLRLGHLFLITIATGGDDIGKEARKAMEFLIFVAAPLLFLAAMIETFITPLVISLASR